ncbi:MAG: nucleotidyltransferase domain-containing protein [Prochlorococcaceae cyanobacterium]
MTASARSSSYSYVVDEALLCTIAAEIQAAIPGAEVRLFGSRARGTARPDSDSRFEETGAMGWKLADHRIPIDLLLYSYQEVQDRLQYTQHVVTEAYRHGRELHAG